MSIFTGSAVALITPFTENGVNFAELEKLVDFQIENGTDAIVACGTTGEPSTMTDAEKQSVVACVVQRAARRVPVIAGTGTNNTAKTIALSRAAKDAGADALLVVTPYYNKCTQDGLVAHLAALSDAVELPQILYNVPARTGFNVLPATLKKLTAVKNVVAIKEASANIEQITEMARLCPCMDLYSGNDDHVLPLLALGGKGVISVLANVAPRMTHDLVVAYFAGDIEKSRALQFAVNPLVKALFVEVNPIPVKAAAGMLGYDVGGVRLPLTPATESTLALLREQLAALNLL